MVEITSAYTSKAQTPFAPGNTHVLNQLTADFGTFNLKRLSYEVACNSNL
jgi:hypothetical protein